MSSKLHEHQNKAIQEASATVSKSTDGRTAVMLPRRHDESMQDMLEKVDELAEQVREKLSERGHRYEGPMTDLAELVEHMARQSFPDDMMALLDPIELDNDLVKVTKNLSEMAELLIPPKTRLENKVAQDTWMSLILMRSEERDFRERLHEHWRNDIDEEDLECWTKDVYSPEKIRDDVKEVIAECLNFSDRVNVFHQDFTEKGGKLAEFMLKEWKPDDVSEFSSRNPPTYEDGIKAAKVFVRYTKNQEAKLEAPGLH